MPGLARQGRGVFEVIVAGSHLRYDGVWQRPHQVLSRLAARVPVLWVEEARNPAGYADAETCAAATAWSAGRCALVWLYTPMMLALADAFEGAPVVYDCMDDLSAFAFAPPHMAEREAQLLARASVVFAGGRSLFERCRARRADTKLYPSGVEFEHFARSVPPHPLVARLPRPVYGYIGVIDERIDLSILAELGRRPGSVVAVGPTAKIDPATLPHGPSLQYTGQIDYAALPSLLAGFDVAIMPFAHNAATASISPTKTLEYLAAGKPVVSTSICDVVAGFGDVVRIADGAQGFADACEAEAAGPDPVRVAGGIERARTSGWDSIVAAMWDDLRG